MNIKKFLLFLVLIIAAIGVLLFNYINKTHRNVSKEDATISITAKEFHSIFITNQDQFNNKYLDKVIELKGVVTTIESNSIILNDNFFIVFKDSILQSISINDKVFVKGRYVGYDDLLEQLKFDQAILMNNN